MDVATGELKAEVLQYSVDTFGDRRRSGRDVLRLAPGPRWGWRRRQQGLLHAKGGAEVIAERLQQIRDVDRPLALRQELEDAERDPRVGPRQPNGLPPSACPAAVLVPRGSLHPALGLQVVRRIRSQANLVPQFPLELLRHRHRGKVQSETFAAKVDWLLEDLRAGRRMRRHQRPQVFAAIREGQKFAHGDELGSVPIDPAENVGGDALDLILGSGGKVFPEGGATLQQGPQADEEFSIVDSTRIVEIEHAEEHRGSGDVVLVRHDHHRTDD
mmetsp:Transcript_54296/g.156104  ORF Transcript_54296/g.156104 Transcript_54296/m.156104 type:complete len:272 (-) Transcript_54296:319-1134(-)